VTTGQLAKRADPAKDDPQSATDVKAVDVPAVEVAPATPAGSPVAGKRPQTGDRKTDFANTSAANSTTPAPEIRPVVKPAPLGLRHVGLMLAFLLLVIVPVALTTWYLETRAVPQYGSTLGFTVRSDETPAATDFIGSVGTALGASTSKDSDILYEYIRSQEMVGLIDSEVDLEGLYSLYHDRDPIFAYAPGGTAEDLLRYWSRIVRIAYDSNSGMIELRVLAFSPEEATRIATLIRDASATKINELSAFARADVLQYASADLDRAVEQVKAAREAVTSFRMANNMVDVSADVEGQMGIVGVLEEQLATAMIDLDILRSTTRDDDPRIDAAETRIAVIQAHIDEERAKVGSDSSASGYAAKVGEFERLSVEREFAEQRYLAAMRAFELAQSEANRRSRYLVTYVGPTLAERAEYPQRLLLIAGVALFALVLWSVLSLIFYSIRDRN
jgi:capsular polysaccharide transport system permease protein